METDPCTDQECDGCRLCKRGVCCRRDVPGYELPEAGSWPGEYVGTLGQMEYTDQGLVLCHICGTGFENLSVHVYAHGTWPDEYRSYFGLNRRQSLLSRGMRERWSQRSSAPVFVEALSAPAQHEVTGGGS